jgi:hypothetical protein
LKSQEKGKLHVEASLALDVLQDMKQTSQLERPTKRRTRNSSFPRHSGKGRVRTMKKELGDWTRRFFLCLSFSSSAGGLSRSMSFWSTCAPPRENPLSDRGGRKRTKEGRRSGSRRSVRGDHRTVPSYSGSATTAAEERSEP